MDDLVEVEDVNVDVAKRDLISADDVINIEDVDVDVLKRDGIVSIPTILDTLTTDLSVVIDKLSKFISAR